MDTGRYSKYQRQGRLLSCAAQSVARSYSLDWDSHAERSCDGYSW
jgi:hypothetical protein